jgi:hypothetical protein
LHRYLDHLRVTLPRLPGLIVFLSHRKKLAEMIAFCHSLSKLLNDPLTEVMPRITPGEKSGPPSIAVERRIRQLADMAALLDRKSPLGLCLRRSLVRYYFLRESGLPVCIHFGAKFKENPNERQLAGHAWTSLNNIPYYESKRDLKGFTSILAFPNETEQQTNQKRTEA